MPKTIWSGAISFGLVNVPVKLTTAVQRHDVRFHQLHAADGSRIEQRRVCKADGQEVGWDELAKGYEIEPDQYVVIQKDELDALDPQASRTIDILDFVNAAEIDPIYFQHPYYLVPDREPSEKAYALLRDAMTKAKKVAIARFVMRGKEYLGVIRARENALLLSTMLYADEVVALDRVEGLPDSDPGIPKKEIAMAEALIEQLTTEFEPERYRDEYRERVMELIQRKAAGEKIVAAPSAEPRAAVVDLVEALEASIEEAEKRRSA